MSALRMFVRFKIQASIKTFASLILFLLSIIFLKKYQFPSLPGR